jgi:YD repeat-containing protein
MNLARVTGFFAASSMMCASVSAQDVGKPVNAKSVDTVSPTGVSYMTGSFVHDLELFTIGSGEFPDRISVSLHYDSSNQVDGVSGWSLSSALDASSMVINAEFDMYDQHNEPSGAPLYDVWQYAAYFTIGNRAKAVEILDQNLALGQFYPATKSGYSMTYDTDNQRFTFLSRDGERLEVGGYIDNGRLWFGEEINFTSPSGSNLSYNGYHRNDIFTGSRLVSSRGIVIVKESANLGVSPRTQKICAYNLAFIDESSTYNCTQSTLAATLHYQDSNLIQVAKPDGSVHQFEYQLYNDVRGYTLYNGKGDAHKSPKTRYRLSCVRLAGQPCKVVNTYDACDGYSGQSFPNPGLEDAGWTGSRDRVTRQVLADGAQINYAYPGQTTPCRDVLEIRATDAVGALQVGMELQDNWPLNVGYLARNFPLIKSVTDQIGRSTQYKWTGSLTVRVGRDDLLSEITYPEGNKLKYTYDDRGNTLETRMIPKPGSGLTDIVYSSTFPASCANPASCNKPATTTDANDATTAYTYSPDHGGVLSAVGPAVAGVSPSTKYYYAQRYPWLKNGAGYMAGSSPIWVLIEERTCRTSGLDLATGACSAGSADMVQKLYDYGPDSGPNNLWLRGVAFVSNGETLRTCYGYDQVGRRISATGPRAALATCP